MYYFKYYVHALLMLTTTAAGARALTGQSG